MISTSILNHRLSGPSYPLIIVTFVNIQGRILWRVFRLNSKPSQLEMGHGMDIFISHTCSFSVIMCLCVFWVSQEDVFLLLIDGPSYSI
jgi:hypothetical protein